jgi:hypothetical protein
MRKERMIPMMFLAVVLVAAITLPLGFATTVPPYHHTKNYVPINRYVPHTISVQPAPNATTPKAPAQQSGNDLLIQSTDL